MKIKIPATIPSGFGGWRDVIKKVGPRDGGKRILSSVGTAEYHAHLGAGFYSFRSQLEPNSQTKLYENLRCLKWYLKNYPKGLLAKDRRLAERYIAQAESFEAMPRPKRNNTVAKVETMAKKKTKTRAKKSYKVTPSRVAKKWNETRKGKRRTKLVARKGYGPNENTRFVKTISEGVYMYKRKKRR